MSGYVDKIETIIDEFNHIHGFKRGVIFRSVHWRKDIVGQVTMDSQASINDQLLQEYDLMIAVIGDRLGQKTARAESGTAEEIELALEKSDAIFGGRHVQIIFKTKMDVDINNIDVEQIDKVRKFKESLYKRAIVADFADDADFDGVVSRFLASAANDVEGADAANISGQRATGSATDTSIDGATHVEQLASEKLGTKTAANDALGFYDELEKANEAAVEQARLTEAYGAILNDIATQLPSIVSMYGDDQQKRRFDHIGDMLSEKARAMDIVVRDMKRVVTQHSESFENVLLMLDEFASDADDEVQALRNLAMVFGDTAQIMEQFIQGAEAAKEATQSSPRATQRFNHGKRNAARAMGEMIDLVNNVSSRMREYHSYVQSHLESIESKSGLPA